MNGSALQLQLNALEICETIRILRWFSLFKAVIIVEKMVAYTYEASDETKENPFDFDFVNGCFLADEEGDADGSREFRQTTRRKTSLRWSASAMAYTGIGTHVVQLASKQEPSRNQSCFLQQAGVGKEEGGGSS